MLIYMETKYPFLLGKKITCKYSHECKHGALNNVATSFSGSFSQLFSPL